MAGTFLPGAGRKFLNSRIKQPLEKMAPEYRIGYLQPWYKKFTIFHWNVWISTELDTYYIFHWVSIYIFEFKMKVNGFAENSSY